jgi:hypothetical protein
MTKKYLNTTWEVWCYDVFGNRKDGYEVNDRACIARDVTVRTKINTHNVGTPREVQSASLSNTQIRRLLGIKRYAIDVNGDDVHYYVSLVKDGFPVGEILCTSHTSLSPIKEA